MNKLFNFTQAKGKWHKFPSFNLGGGAKLYKNFAQKLLAVSLCMAVVLLGTPAGGRVSESLESEHTVVELIFDSVGPQSSGVTLFGAFLPGSRVVVRVRSSPGFNRSGDGYFRLGSDELFFYLDDGCDFSVLVPASRAVSWSYRDVSTPAYSVSGSFALPALPYLGWSDVSLISDGPAASLSLPSTLRFCSHPDCVPTLTSSNSGVAAVSGGPSEGWSVSPVSAGTATLTLTTGGVTNWTGTVTVAAGSVSVTRVSLDKTALELAVGGDETLTATIFPENATNKAVKWTSSEPTVASVDENGTVKALKAGSTTITVTTEDGDHTATCVVTVTAAGDTPPPATTPDSTPDTTPDTPPADTPADSSYLETTVTVKGKTQRLRVYDPNGVLPEGTTLSAEAVTAHEHIDDDHEIEHLLSYSISLLDAAGDALPMPLSNTVELCFEVMDGLDRGELEVVLVKEFDDAEFEETLVDLDGASWVKVKTDHFSPYALIDKLTPEEKGVQVQDGPGPAVSSSDSNSGAGNNAKTGDLATQITVAGLGMTLVLALGIMLRLITSKRKFEE